MKAQLACTIGFIALLGGLVVGFVSIRSSLSVLRQNQTSFVESTRATQLQIDNLETRLDLRDDLLARLLESETSRPAPAPAPDPATLVQKEERAVPSERASASWPFMLEADLPPRFQGRFSGTDVFVDLGAGSVGRLAFMDGLDPYADPEKRALAEELLMAFLDRHDYLRGEILRRIQVGEFQGFASSADAQTALETLEAGGRSGAIEELPENRWAVVDITGVTEGSAYNEASERISSIPDKLGTSSAYFGVYAADHPF